MPSLENVIRFYRANEEYNRQDAVVFRETRERFGGLSNMAGGFPLRVNGLEIRTLEALYQACRFPHRPDFQREILERPSPMGAKMRARRYQCFSRADWEAVRVPVMRWCLRVKLAEHRDPFSTLLLATAPLPIVEESRRDAFWGARPVDDRLLRGANVLGRLLMELREELQGPQRAQLGQVAPLDIPDFLLLGRPIET